MERNNRSASPLLASNGPEVNLGSSPVLEGSRLLSFDRKHYGFGPLSSFASREGIIGWNQAFADLFHVDHVSRYGHRKCGELVKAHAGRGSASDIEKIHQAMKLVDDGKVASFRAYNQTSHNVPVDIVVEVVVVPISIRFLDEDCNLIVGFQVLADDHSQHLENIKNIGFNRPGEARDMLLRWAEAELVQFIRMHPLFNRLLNICPSYSQTTLPPFVSDDLHAFIASSDKAAVVITDYGSIATSSATFRRAVGYSSQELNGRDIVSVLDEDPDFKAETMNFDVRASQPLQKPSLSSVFEPEDPRPEAEPHTVKVMRLSCKDGTRKLVSGRVHPVGQFPNSPGVSLFTFTDGSVIRNALQTMVDGKGVAAILLSMRGSILYANRRWTSFSGFSATELIGMHMDNMAHSRQRDDHRRLLTSVAERLLVSTQSVPNCFGIIYSEAIQLPDLIVCVRKNGTKVQVRFHATLASLPGLPLGVIEHVQEAFPVPKLFE